MPIGPRPSVAALEPYQWEDSSAAIAARLRLPVEDVVRFDMNTVPWQLPAGWAAGAEALNEYPDTSYADLTRAIAAYCDVPESSVVVGAGGDELISLIAQAYLDSSRHYAVSDPTYSLFAVASDIAGATRRVVPSDGHFRLDRAAFLAAAADAHVTWLANPNNPTGEVLPQDFVREVARATRGVVVVDEAYAEFSGASSLPWCFDVENVVVLRTLSKAFGLAGMRVGWVVASPAVTAVLAKVRPVSSISVVSARLGVAALEQAEAMRTLVRDLAVERQRLAAALADLGCRVVEGSANFVLAVLDAAGAARAQSHGLVLRTYGAGHRLHGWSRITVRSPAENARLLDALRS